MNKTPLVTIVCITYNQEKFIGQALDGFLMQQTNFPFEVLIHDDASTDSTPAIIERYVQEHGDVVRPILETENQYSKGGTAFVKNMFVTARGKYIAVCEGDDFWTDPQKLQLQVDFLEKNPGHALVFHPVNVVYEKHEQPDSIFPEPGSHARFSVRELLRGNFIQTNSVMYRKQDYASMRTDVTPNDWHLHLFHAQFGKIGFIDRVMSTYRRHRGGMWWEASGKIDQIWKKHGLAHLALYVELLRMYGKTAENRHIIGLHIAEMFHNLMLMDTKYGETLVRQAMAQFPEAGESVIVAQNKEIQLKNAEMQQRAEAYQAQLDKLHQTLQQKSQELDHITSTRLWRTRNRVAKILKRH